MGLFLEVSMYFASKLVIVEISERVLIENQLIDPIRNCISFVQLSVVSAS